MDTSESAASTIDTRITDETSRSGRMWAGPRDWNLHRDTIIELYQDQGLKLAEVRHIMASRGFHATPKMYKDRLRQWGVRKNAASICPAKRTRAQQQQPVRSTTTTTTGPSPPPPPPSPRGPDPQARIVLYQGDMSGPKSFQASLTALRELVWASTAAAATTTTTTAAAASRPAPPSPEAIGCSPTARWMAQMATGAMLIRSGGRHVAAGFRLVDACCARVAACGTSSSPSSGTHHRGPALFTYLGMGGFVLSYMGEDLWRAFVGHAAALAQVRAAGGSSRGAETDPMARYARYTLSLGFEGFVRHYMGLGLFNMDFTRACLGEDVFTQRHADAYMLLQIRTAALVFADPRWLLGDGEEGDAGQGGDGLGSEASASTDGTVGGGANEGSRGENEALTLWLRGKELDTHWHSRIAMWDQHEVYAKDVLRRAPSGKPVVCEEDGMRFLTFGETTISLE